MFLRKLTAAEEEQIRQAKTSANDVIKAKRDEICKRMKPATAKLRRQLQHDLTSWSLVTGKPVIIQHLDDRICLDYELLRKFVRSLKGCPSVWVQVQMDKPGTTLSIGYSRRDGKGHGAMNLFELRHYSHELLKDLPVIEIG